MRLQITVKVHHGLLLAPFDSLCNNPADVHQPGIFDKPLQEAKKSALFYESI